MDFSELDELGFGLVSGVITFAEIEEIRQRLPNLDGVAGTRNLLMSDWCRELAADLRLINLVQAAIGSNAKAVRAILFDKTSEANWTLGWHQDTKIAVRRKAETAGFSAWSEKEGVVHCQPPVEVLDRSMAVRIHIDQSGSENGPLRVIPGSHRAGIQSEVDQTRISNAVECFAESGDVILMKPLLWHASSKSLRPEQHRRVIHIEYCAADLPGGLEWAYRVSLQ